MVLPIINMKQKFIRNLIKRKRQEIQENNKKNAFISKANIDDLRCQILPFSEIQGFSGKPIDHFPPYQFFNQYTKNSRQAQINFYNWLHYCLIDLQGWKIPKKQGGWQNGSLHKLIIKLHADNNISLVDMLDADSDLLSSAISSRVNYYLTLFEKVKNDIENGDKIDPISCFPENSEGLIIIYDGHHRTAALKILGLTQVDVIYKK